MIGYLILVLASVAFVGSHFLMSHTLRRDLDRIFGAGGFSGVYSHVARGTFIWMIFAFRGAPDDPPLWVAGDTQWIIASVLTLISAVLFAGSLSGNPALPASSAAKLAAKRPHNVFCVTRHPMMWSFALWGVGHILIAPRPAVLILSGSIVFLALVGAKAQERKKMATIGVDWEQWCSHTSYFPNPVGFAKITPFTWIAGIAIWLAATWAHGWFDVPAAGLFRWLSL